MMLRTVTITGAADDTDIENVIDLSAEFPFVEWGILVSKSQEASGRFPSRKWMEELSLAATDHRLHVSTHLCGQWVRNLLLGRLDWKDVPPIPALSERVQINTHGRSHEWTSEMFDCLKRLPGKQVIFQWDEANNFIPYAAYAHGVETAVLFDLSGGAGILPEEWPVPKASLPCGYAGGLSPENVQDQLQRIASVCDRPFWIDMERRVRSDDDSILDLAKVRRVLASCAPHVLEQ